jgi:hypothetical protein
MFALLSHGVDLPGKSSKHTTTPVHKPTVLHKLLSSPLFPRPSSSKLCASSGENKVLVLIATTGYRLLPFTNQLHQPHQPHQLQSNSAYIIIATTFSLLAKPYQMGSCLSMSSLTPKNPSGLQAHGENGNARTTAGPPDFLDENGKYDAAAAGREMAKTGRTAGGMGYGMVGGAAGTS